MHMLLEKHNTNYLVEPNATEGILGVLPGIKVPNQMFRCGATETNCFDRAGLYV